MLLPVSYTHLDAYTRQVIQHALCNTINHAHMGDLYQCKIQIYEYRNSVNKSFPVVLTVYNLYFVTDQFMFLFNRPEAP